MSQDRPPISRKHAELIIDGRPGGRTVDSTRPDPLTTLLAVAAGPARKGEIAGEDAASAAFRHHCATRSPLRVILVRPPLGRLISPKVVALALATTATGGLALASATETLQLGLHPKPSPLTRPADSPSRPAAGPPASPAPAPDPAQVKLCRTYQAAAHGNPGQVQHNPAFSSLAAASGGANKVAGYCIKLLAAADPTPHPSGTKPDKPGKTKNPGAPADPTRPGPGGEPTDPGSQGRPRPSGEPPTGKPPNPHRPGVSSPRPKPHDAAAAAERTLRALGAVR